MANTKITTDALADGAITSAKLGSGAVNTQVASYLSSNSFVDTTALNSAVSTAVSNLVGSAPSTLDTLEELATSIGNSATLSSTLTSSIATKLPLAGGTLTGDLILGDSIKLELGAGTGGDLQLYHDGSHSYVTNTYASGALKLVSDDFRIENASNRNQLKTGVSGAVQLFFDDGSATGLRLGTTAAGVDVTGNIVVSGTVDGVDIAARDAVLTSTTTTAGAALPKAGGTMTGNLNVVHSGQAIIKADGVNQYYTGIKIRNNYSSTQSDWNLAASGGTSGWGGTNGNFIIRDDTTNSTGIEIEKGAGGTTGALYIDSSGKVGIGTASPSNPITADYSPQVIGNLTSSNSTSDWNTASAIMLRGASGSNGLGFGVSGQANDRKSWIQSGHPDQQHSNYFGTLAINPMGGNVGIGTSSPSAKLDIAGGNIFLDNAYGLFIGDGNTGMIGRGSADTDSYVGIRVNGGTDKITVKSTGNVGIGTGSPGYLLTVKKDVDAFAVKIENDGNSAGTSGASYADASDGLWVDTRWNTATNTPFKVTSNSGNTPMMIIKGDGKVGIGNSNPYFALHVQGSTGFNGQAKNNILAFDTTSATTGTGGGIAFGGYSNGTGGDTYHFGNIQGIKENSTAGNYASALLFSTRAAGATPVEQMRIDSAGHVGIRTTPSAWGTDYAVLDLNTGGSIYGTTSGVTTSSNLYFTGSAWIAKNTGLGTLYAQHTGKYLWYSSGSVSAGSGAPLSQKMELSASGNLGIGVASPDSYPAGATTGSLSLPLEEIGMRLIFKAASGNGHAGISTIDQAGAGLMIGANTYVNSGGSVVYGRSDHPSSGIYFDGWSGDRMRFYTGATGNPTERMSILADGRVGIGGIPAESDTLTVTTTGTNGSLRLVNSNSGSGSTKLIIENSSASPAANDGIGEIQFIGKNTAGNANGAAYVSVIAEDVTNGSYDSSMNISTLVAGYIRNRIRFTPTQTVVNEDSQTLNFRVESNNNDNMLYVDGTNDRVGIGRVPATHALEVAGHADFKSNASVAGSLAAGATVITSADSSNAFIVKTDHSGNPTALQIGGAGAINGVSSANQSFTILNVAKDSGSNKSAYFHGHVKTAGVYNTTHTSSVGHETSINILNNDPVDGGSDFDQTPTNNSDGGGTTWSISGSGDAIYFENTSGGHGGTWMKVNVEEGYYVIKGTVRLTNTDQANIHTGTSTANYKYTHSFRFEISGGPDTGHLKWDADAIATANGTDFTRAGFCSSPVYMAAGNKNIAYYTNGYNGVQQIYITNLELVRIG